MIVDPRRPLVALLGALLFASPARAFDAQAYAPAVDPHGFFSVASSRLVPEGWHHVALAYDFASEPVADAGLVDRLHTLRFQAGYAVLDNLELGLDVPLSHVDGALPGASDGLGIDAVRLLGRFQVADPMEAAVGFALVPFVDLPTGDEDRLTVSGGTDYGLLGVLDHMDEPWRGALNLGFRVTAGGTTQVDEILFGVALARRVSPSVELLGEVFGSTSQSSPFDGQFVTPVEGHAGLRWAEPESPWFVRLGAGRAITDGINGPELRVSLAIGWAPGPPRSVPPAPVSPLPRVSDVVVTDEEVVPLAPVLFASGSSHLEPQGHAILDRVAEAIIARPGSRWRIEGHTDARGDVGDNVDLSLARARAVEAALVARGIEPSRLEAVGVGEARPVATNDTPEGRARNRRTELHRLP